MVNKYVHNHNDKIYASFVDFRKAFDSVCHNGLLHIKLLQINLAGSFYNLIKSLYSKSSCSIKIDQYQTRPFQYARGVRQGCILSPLLFKLVPNGTKLSALLYADDLIILSRYKTGLQNCLNALASYCNTWMLSINPKKTKIIVFQKRAKNCSEQTFYIENQAIDVVQDYTYLETKISSSGNLKISLDHLKEKALHALFSLRRHANFSKLKPSLACKIFDTLISPILLYNSEIWGGYVKSDFKAWDGSQIEKYTSTPPLESGFCASNSHMIK